MFQSIIKRNGAEVRFDAEKIAQAIAKAGAATGEFDAPIAKLLSLRALTMAQQTLSKKLPSVEEIQDIVEEVLLASPYRKTAKAYILYRDQHARIREITASANGELVDQYLNQQDWRVNENSNMTFSLQGLNNYVSSEISSSYWLNQIYPSKIRKAHLEGDFHIHDLNVLAVYCVGWDLKALLVEGFRGVSGKVESRPARHFRSALGQIVNFFYTLQGEAAGAQAFSSFDTLLAPFIRFDRLTYADVKQALQEFLFNINVPTRVGFQTPFTNVTLDLVVPATYADEAVIIGGELQDVTYREFQPEMDLFNKAFLEVMYEGDAAGRVFTFPIPTYNITPDFDWDNPSLDMLWKVTARYGVPYFSNFVNSDMRPEDARSMCCRLRLDNRELKKRGGGLFGSYPLTGSIGVVTINLPRIGYLAHDEDEFLSLLEDRLVLARESLEIKRKVLEQFTRNNLYPYSKYYLRDIEKHFGSFWKNHFSTIGVIGMNEACWNLFGEGIASGIGQKFALRVMDYLRGRLLEFQESTGNSYNLEASPAEGASYRLAKLDRNRYPDIISASTLNDLEGGAREPFYTNSTQLPVNYTDDMFEYLDLQDELQCKYTGGTVVHLFSGERVEDYKAVKALARTICNNYKLPYFTFTPTFSVCPDHAYIAGEVETCPKCGKPTEIYSRVTGYLRPVAQWNKGKKVEFELRKTFKLKKEKLCV